MIELLFALALATTPNVGLASFTAIDRAHADTLHAAIWYPTSAPAHTVTLRLQTFDVAENAPLLPANRRYPVVLVSHGTGGDEFGHWDTIEALARAGFIVVSIRHAGDNSRDHSGLGTDRYLYGRSTQMRALLNAILADSMWSRHLDAKRIAFLGYSAGGFTGLELLGAKPNVARLSVYCSRHSRDPLYCADGLRGSFTMSGSYAGPAADPRIRSAALLAPAFSFLFDSAQIARIRSPILIARAEHDMVVVEPDNVSHLLHSLPTRPQVIVMRGAGHYTFLAPCGAGLARIAPEICQDSPNVSRVQLHTMLNRGLIAFFKRTLAVATQQEK